MKANISTITVLIDKQAQNDRRDKIGSIMIDPRYIAMTRNLQHGVVQYVGSNVSKYDDYIQPGDIALFHHSVEENEMVLLETKENGDEIRIVHPIPHEYDYRKSSQLYGIIKPDGTVIPHSSYVFLSNDIIDLDEPVQSAALLVAEELDATRKLLMQEEKTAYRKALEASFNVSRDIGKREDIYREVQNILGQQDKIAGEMNKPRRVIATVSHAGPVSNKIGIADGASVTVDPGLLYPLNIMGLSFFIIRNKFLDGICG